MSMLAIPTGKATRFNHGLNFPFLVFGELSTIAPIPKSVNASTNRATPNNVPITIALMVTPYQQEAQDLYDRDLTNIYCNFYTIWMSNNICKT